MCYLLILTNEFDCGHRFVFRRDRIDCNSTTCSLSASHRLDCIKCTSTCRQSLMQDQTWNSGRLRRPCENCLSK
ncbi:hypothetical protein C8J55DRAFT_514066 [Lentinula edodes]|uniref:Uncharacterized protein n=1 Tax=Lentinula lateritia TaxID=40482 RepID=A0A9W9ACP2_9AGAR|nr:hypothetical protein C8J55DRAFT_514066 [Lentinula edodes]